MLTVNTRRGKQHTDDADCEYSEYGRPEEPHRDTSIPQKGRHDGDERGHNAYDGAPEKGDEVLGQNEQAYAFQIEAEGKKESMLATVLGYVTSGRHAKTDNTEKDAEPSQHHKNNKIRVFDGIELHESFIGPGYLGSVGSHQPPQLNSVCSPIGVDEEEARAGTHFDQMAS